MSKYLSNLTLKKSKQTPIEKWLGEYYLFGSESSDILRRPQKFDLSSTYDLILDNLKNWKMGQIFVAFSEYLNKDQRQPIVFSKKMCILSFFILYVSIFILYMQSQAMSVVEWMRAVAFV